LNALLPMGEAAMFARRPFVIAFLTLVLAGALALGCDPKLTGTDGSGGGGDGGGNGDDEVALVTPEARALGAIIATHLQIMQAALSTAEQFDDSASAAPVLRDFFTSDCLTLTTLDAVAPVIEISFGDSDPADNCVDSRNTVYRGGGTIERVAGLDGFIFDPYGWLDAALIATNAEDDQLNHTYQQGTLTFTFVRAGTGEATAIEVSNWLKHGMLSTIASFTYIELRFNGSPGSSAAFPSSGGSVQVSWDGIENTVVQFSGTSLATFTLVGVDYNINLATGEVTLALV
jgi:hypothetical protein